MMTAPIPPPAPSENPATNAHLVLVVDDQPANLKVLHGILASTPYQLTFASSGQQALDRIQLNPPDLILLDVLMPSMDGLEVCRRLAESTDYAQIPVIFLTANHDLETLTAAFALGAVDYVIKPFRTPELLARIKTHLQLRSLQQQLQHQSRQEQVLRQIIADIHSGLEIRALLTHTVQQIQQFLPLPRVLIGQYTTPDRLHLIASSDADFPTPSAHPWIASPTATQVALQSRTPLTAADAAWLQHWQIQSERRYPLWCQDDLWGCLILQSSESAIGDTDWEVFIQLITHQLQIALERAKLLRHQAELLQQREQANAELARLANIDPLTQLVNRRYLDTCLEQEWLRLTREQQPLSIIMLDVDYFKRYNDTYGHLQGDECLRLIGQVLAEVTKRPADVAARYGGEEFIMVLPNTPASGAIAVAEHIQDALRQLQLPHASHLSDHQVTLSLGIVTEVPAPETTWRHLLELADQVLYEAKAQGRNCYVLATPN